LIETNRFARIAFRPGKRKDRAAMGSVLFQREMVETRVLLSNVPPDWLDTGQEQLAQSK
jgi:hypothetical protein